MEFPDRIESWRAVPGWPGYEVSDKGQVRSLDRWVERRSSPQWWPGRVLRPATDGPYVSVMLRQPGRSRRYRIHVLVLEVFAGTCPPGQLARHGPAGQRVNWWPENLCWGTQVDNMGPDRFRDGTLSWGEHRPLAKLTVAIVTECRLRRAAGEPVIALAAEFGVTRGVMYRAVTGRTWQHVPQSPARSRPYAAGRAATG